MEQRTELALQDDRAQSKVYTSLLEACKGLAPAPAVTRINLPPARAEDWLARFFAYVFARPAGSATELQVTEWAQKLRGLDETAHLVFFADDMRQAGAYIRPAIRPSAVLLPPVSPARLREVLQEILAQAQTATGGAKGPVFQCSTGGQAYLVPVADILFFEAAAKRMLLRTKGQEIAFYASFQQVLAQLPGGFFRCHKGFLVNLGQVAAVDYGQMSITMQDGSSVPLARSAKAELRRLLAEGGAPC